jgi:nicotinate dehydrogenase subunit B
MKFTSDAQLALSRRNFLKTSGALIVGFSAGLQTSLAQGGPSPGSPAMGQVDSWIAIAADGSITAYSGKEELGQGISTAQQQLVAEELSVPFQRVKLIYCDTALTPDQAHTSGSQSHPVNFNNSNLGQAGATAREALLQMASAKFNMPADRLRIVNGVIHTPLVQSTSPEGTISARPDSGQSVSYGELVAGKKFNLPLSKTAKRKHPSTWTVLGKPLQRPDMPLMATGTFEYIHNVKVPGMLHGRVVRPPMVGATVINVDEGSIKDIPGVERVVVRKNFVGVVAQKQYQAMQAAAKLKVEWSKGTGMPDHATFFESIRKPQPSRDIMLVDSGDTAAKLNSAATVVKASYYHPNQMHGSLGASCAVADVQGDKATIYSPTQGVWYQRSACATLLGLKPENIHVMFRRGSGCYGLNGADAATYDAAILSQEVGKPVRVQLTRKDEMAWENYGHAHVMDENAGLDAQGNITVWEHEAWIPAKGNRPGAVRPGNIVTGTLLGFEPDPFQPRTPAPAPNAYNNNSNGIPSYVAGRVKGKDQGTGRIASERVLVHNLVSPVFTGPLRSPARLQNTFAHESFMDELAAKSGADPVEFRLKHLKSERVIGVLEAAAKAAKWEKRVSPRATAKTGIVTGRGVAVVAYEGDNGYTAIVVEVNVNQQTGKIDVKRMWVAIDAGPISNPDGLKQQAEGGALQGMSRALGEEVTWDHEKITSVDWRSYHSLPVGFEIPKIECVLVNQPDEEATGAGETSITVIGAAIGNAVFDATGARLRQIPFTPERVKAALDARG